MFEMIFDSVKLFFTGRLFQNFSKVIQLFLVGVLCGTAILVALGYFVSPIVGAIGGGLVAGIMQPVLFKNLKYK